MNKDIFLTNNLSNKKEKFVPLDNEKTLACMFVAQLFMTIHTLVTRDLL